MKHINTITAVIFVALIIYGFMQVTQTGQGINVAQNDGNATLGGLLILAGGLGIGRIVGEVYTMRSKK
jgi:hypothetical protein